MADRTIVTAVSPGVCQRVGQFKVGRDLIPRQPFVRPLWTVIRVDQCFRVLAEKIPLILELQHPRPAKLSR
jgi:hypothetical protein